MMNRTNDKSLKDAIEQMLQVYKLKKKFDETSLISIWPEMMGKAVSNRTKMIYVRERKLYVKVESSVIKSELMMIKSQIVDKLNTYAGNTVIDDVIFL